MSDLLSPTLAELKEQNRILIALLKVTQAGAETIAAVEE